MRACAKEFLEEGQYCNNEAKAEAGALLSALSLPCVEGKAGEGDTAVTRFSSVVHSVKNNPHSLHLKM